MIGRFVGGIVRRAVTRTTGAIVQAFLRYRHTPDLGILIKFPPP